VVSGANGTVVGADWNGPASMAYELQAFSVSNGMRDLSSSLNDAAHAARTFAHALESAQKRAKAARKRANEAIDAINTAKGQLEDAIGRQQGAEIRAGTASDQMMRAGAVGPAGETVRATAQAMYDDAMRDANAAADDARRAQAALDRAQDDLRDARKDGKEANDDADKAATTASGAFNDAAAGAVPPTSMPTPVPVSLRGANPDLAGLGAGAIGGLGAGPSWLNGPGRYATPAQARAAQIAALRQAAEDAAAGKRPPLNTLQKIGQKMMTAGSSIVDVPTFGYMSKGLEWAAGDDRAVDQDSGLYKHLHTGADIAGLVTVAGLAKHGGKKILGRFADDAVHGAKPVTTTVSGASHAVQPRKWTTTVVDGKKVHQRDDLIDPLQKDDFGRTNLERMADGDAPLGPDGKPLNLHHTLQTDKSPVAEVTQTMHTKHRRILHINWPPKDFPSGIDRPAFDKWREDYWTQRGLDFPEP
jgi:hypothetical protein